MDWLGITIYGLSILSICILAAATLGQLRVGLRPYEAIIKKAAFGVLILCAFYWNLSIPSAGYIPEPEPLPEIKAIESNADVQKYLETQRDKIIFLERELYKQRELSEQLIKHYKDISFLGLLALIYFGSFLIFGKRNPDQQGPPHDIIKLDIDK